MANAEDTGTGTTGTTGGTMGGLPDPALAFSGIRYYVNHIENLALQAYWTNAASWVDIKTCLDAAIVCLESVIETNDDDDCPWPKPPNRPCIPIG